MTDKYFIHFKLASEYAKPILRESPTNKYTESEASAAIKTTVNLPYTMHMCILMFIVFKLPVTEYGLNYMEKVKP